MKHVHTDDFDARKHTRVHHRKHKRIVTTIITHTQCKDKLYTYTNTDTTATTHTHLHTHARTIHTQIRYLFGCKVSCYTHYPTISTDMLSLVQRREATYNNRAFISKSTLFTTLKLIYYRGFALLYGIVGRCAHTAMCNSSWTAAHIRDIWGKDAAVLYPPCNTDKLQKMPLEKRERLVISLGQFRPEKNHALQVCVSVYTVCL
jgi:hypothetical protein